MIKKIFCISCLVFLILSCCKADGLNAVFSKDGLDVIAVSSAGNVLRSPDGGVTWSSSNIGSFNLTCVYSITSNIWIGSENGTLFRSINNGANWSTLSYFPPIRSIYFINANTGFFAANFGRIYRTTDGGNGWLSIPSGTLSNLNSIRFGNALTGGACGSNGAVVISTNGGSNWSALTTPVNKELLSIDIKSSTIIASGLDASVIISTNMGSSWNILDYNFVTASDVNSVFMIDTNTFYSAGGGGFIRKSTDAGQNSTFQVNPLLARLDNIYFYDNNIGWAVGKSNNVVLRTTNGGTNWLIPTGTTQSFTLSLKIPTSGTYGNVFALSEMNKKEIFVATAGNIYRSLDGGDNWSAISSINYGQYANSMLISPKDSNLFLVTLVRFGPGDSSKVLRSTNYGISWTASYIGPIDADDVPLAIDPGHPDTVYFTTRDSIVLKSNNFGLTWSPAGPTKFRYPCVIKVLEGNSNILLIGSIPYIYRSTDYGFRWTIVDSSDGGEIPFIATTKFDHNMVYAAIFGGSRTGIHRSTNLGLTWTIINNDPWPWALDIAKDDPNVISYGRVIGNLSISVDRGTTFLEIPSSNWEWFALLNYDRSTILGQAYFTGIFKLQIQYNLPIGIKIISTNVPEKYFLYQNYPNPFNPSTKIKLEIPPVETHDNVFLRIYDILGREVVTLVNEQLKPGTYQVEWDATNFPSGVYFYRLQAGEYTETRKLVLLK